MECNRIHVTFHQLYSWYKMPLLALQPQLIVNPDSIGFYLKSAAVFSGQEQSQGTGRRTLRKWFPGLYSRMEMSYEFHSHYWPDTKKACWWDCWKIGRISQELPDNSQIFSGNSPTSASPLLATKVQRLTAPILIYSSNIKDSNCRRAILSRSRDHLHMEEGQEERTSPEPDQWFAKEKLYKVNKL